MAVVTKNIKKYKPYFKQGFK